MSNFTDEMQELVTTAKHAEALVELLTTFKKKGGAFRISLDVEHPDPVVCQAVKSAADTFMPREILLDTIIRCAGNDAAKARKAIADAVFADAVNAAVSEPAAPAGQKTGAPA